jgi:hypothetical protein
MESTDINRSPFTISIIEIVLAILVGLVTWFGLRKYIQSTLPFPCTSSSVDYISSEEYSWQFLGYPLFSTYALPLIFFLTISTIFLVRAIRRNDLHFSVIGNLALSWPIFSFLGFLLFNTFSLVFFPIGLALSIIAMMDSVMTKRLKWDWLSIPFNLAWLVVFGSFVGRFLSLYGD